VRSIRTFRVDILLSSIKMMAFKMNNIIHVDFHNESHMKCTKWYQRTHYLKEL